METKIGNIKLYVTGNQEDMSKKAAGIISAQINEKPGSVIGFATGSTPVGTYEELIKMHKEQGLDFSGITTFNLDEYYPLDGRNPQSYRYFMFNNLFNHVNVDVSKVNILDGTADNWESEAAEYERKIENAGGIDLQLLGIGTNGHIAFNEPGEVFSGFTTLVNLTEETIRVNSRFFEKEDDVPKTALSMGIRSIMMARKIVLIANGGAKSKAVKDAVFGDITPVLPGSVLQLHQDVTFVVDKEAWGA